MAANVTNLKAGRESTILADVDVAMLSIPAKRTGRMARTQTRSVYIVTVHVIAGHTPVYSEHISSTHTAKTGVPTHCSVFHCSHCRDVVAGHTIPRPD